MAALHIGIRQVLVNVLGDANNDGEIDLEEFLGVLYPVVANALVKMTKEGVRISL